jgi:regulator of replication initiation timing
MKATLKNTVGDVYQINKNGEFSSKTKKLVNNTNSKGNSNFLASMNNERYIPPATISDTVIDNTYRSSISFSSIIMIIVVIIIVVVIGMLIVFKDKIVEVVQSYIKPPEEQENVDKSKLENKIMKLENENKKLQTQTQKQNQKKETKKNESPKKKENKQLESYDPKQRVTSDGYCYIGYDDGIRECAPVYVGDICISGEQYPRLDKCMVPKMIA